MYLQKGQKNGLTGIGKQGIRGILDKRGVTSQNCVKIAICSLSISLSRKLCCVKQANKHNFALLNGGIKTQTQIIGRLIRLESKFFGIDVLVRLQSAKSAQSLSLRFTSVPCLTLHFSFWYTKMHIVCSSSLTGY